MSRLLLIAAALLIAGCAQIQTRNGNTEAAELRWAQRSEALAAVQGFSLQGRFTQAGGSGGNLRWQQRVDDQFELQLSGPFGAGAIAMNGTTERVEVRSKDGTQVTTDPEQWMRQHLGWTLPLDSLRAWALGRPAPGPVGRYELDEAGQLSLLEQGQWTVRFDRYQAVGSLALPGRIEATQGDVQLRLVIDRWEALDIAATSPAVPAPH
ncbi:MAG TPA: lipoprotein insertase outer membrane protein LolB [Fontimonas sp.]